jgi:hypothetical protein
LALEKVVSKAVLPRQTCERLQRRLSTACLDVSQAFTKELDHFGATGFTIVLKYFGSVRVYAHRFLLFLNSDSVEIRSRLRLSF